MTRHVSFDLWGTLIKSNPLYKEKKAKVICDYINTNNLSQEFVWVYTCETKMKLVGDRFDYAMENFKMAPKAEQMIYMLLCELGIDQHLEERHVFNITELCDEAILQESNLPLLYDQNTVDVMKMINDLGITMSVASNTGYVGGVTMTKVLNSLGIAQYFNYFVFSDELGHCKPCGKYFQAVVNTSSYWNVGANEILHVGDRPDADGIEANMHGIKPFIVNSNGKTIVDVFNYVTSEL